MATKVLVRDWTSFQKGGTAAGDHGLGRAAVREAASEAGAKTVQQEKGIKGGNKGVYEQKFGHPLASKARDSFVAGSTKSASGLSVRGEMGGIFLEVILRWRGYDDSNECSRRQGGIFLSKRQWAGRSRWGKRRRERGEHFTNGGESSRSNAGCEGFLSRGTGKGEGELRVTTSLGEGVPGEKTHEQRENMAES